jgi:carboxypeptidase T
MKHFLALLLLCPVAQAGTPYEAIQSRIDALAAAHPDRLTGFTLATTESGIPVQGLEIRGDGSGIPQLVIATHHGDEWGAPQIALAFAAELAERPLPNRTVYLVPVMMPDSYNAKSRNYLGVNPNRDYPGPCGSHDGQPGLEPFTIKATRALSDFMQEKGIVSAIEVHNPWGTVHYPWSDQEHLYTEEHAEFVRVLASAYEGTTYEHSTVPDKFYTMQGAFTDYAFWEFGIWAYLVEVGPSKLPTPAQLAEQIAIHNRAFREVLLLAPTERSRANGHPGCAVGPRRGWAEE